MWLPSHTTLAAMKWSLWLTATIALVLQLSISEGLKCHTDEDSQNPDEFQEVAAICMKNTSGSELNRSDRENKRNGNNYHKNNFGNTNDNWSSGGMGQTFPGYNSETEGYGLHGSGRCTANNDGYNNNRNNMNQNNMNGMRQKPRNRNRRSAQQSEAANVDLEDIEPCAVHCIFRQMGMLGDDALPDRSAVAKVMLRGVKDTEVKDFVQEAVEDCFDQVESDRKGSKCDLSKNVALCLRQKGRENCEDWGEQEDDQQSNQNKNGNNNGNNSNNQYGNKKWN
ncbi:odorant-binding protein 59a [Schistocerca nitens]|uniref:odorant-binding protein 59a n=1 Tax=Schistocerca nitens TaxID=7011 RepID=UPI002118FE6F|nr:odorant-binding protein 59a [Schistocerca nitens]XP_049793908.1 odorant-binding protein 59a [Schistocerca nitens]